MKKFDDYVLSPESQEAYENYIAEMDKHQLLKEYYDCCYKKILEERDENFDHDYDIRLMYLGILIRARMSQ